VKPLHVSGLIAATFSPMHADGSLNLSMVGRLTDRLVADGVSGLYVGGCTGEGPCLSRNPLDGVADAVTSF